MSVKIVQSETAAVSSRTSVGDPDDGWFIKEPEIPACVLLVVRGMAILIRRPNTVNGVLVPVPRVL